MIILLTHKVHIKFVFKVVIERTKRGQGLGQKLLEMLEDFCVKPGYKTLYISASPDTPRFYLRLGYKFTDFRPTVVGSGVSNSAMLFNMM